MSLILFNYLFFRTTHEAEKNEKKNLMLLAVQDKTSKEHSKDAKIEEKQQKINQK